MDKKTKVLEALSAAFESGKEVNIVELEMTEPEYIEILRALKALDYIEAEFSTEKGEESTAYQVTKITAHGKDFLFWKL